MIAFGFAAAGAFEVHNAADAGIDGRNIVGTAGFDQDGEAVIAEGFHEGKNGGLKHGLAAGEFDERKVLGGPPHPSPLPPGARGRSDTEWGSQTRDLGADFV